MTPSATITAVGFSQLNYYPKRQNTLHQKAHQNTLQNFEVSHPIAFSRAYLLATCFCVFYFYFVLLYRANTYRPVLLHCFNLKTCQRYATAIQDITARTKPTYDWCGVDLNHTWLSRLSSSKLPVSTNYLTAIAFTHSATHQQSARLGIEPTTNQLIADCSTTELHADNEGVV